MWSVLRDALEVELSRLINGLDGMYEGKKWVRGDILDLDF